MKPAAAAALVLLAGCASAPKPPPIPLAASAELHVEPDLVGATHVVKKGETIYRIARTYGVEPRDLMEVNDLTDPRLLKPGMEIFVPGALRPLDVPPLPPGVVPEPEPVPSPAPAPRDALLHWPLHGVLYSRFGVRQGQRHDGIDISAPEGTPVLAAGAGVVVYTGRQSGYGAIVIVKHDGGLVTLYAHNSAVLVKDGDRVDAGTPIARVGQSGRTTGPHLHFEVREGTKPRDPIPFLP